MNSLSSRLATHGHAQQVEAVAFTDQIAAGVDRATLRTWGRIRSVLAEESHAFEAQHKIAHILALMAAEAEAGVRDGLVKLAIQAHERTAQTMVRTLPLAYLQAMARRRRPTFEAAPLEFEDVTAPFRSAERLSGQDARELFAQLLFPPPPRDVVLQRIQHAQIGGLTWQQRIKSVAQRQTAIQIAQTIADGYAEGKTQREIARQLMPVVQGVQASAQRCARTYGLAVAHESQFAAHEQLGDFLTAYQIHATLDGNTRPLHRARNGTIYYKRPKRGQLGFDQMPKPPIEADGEIAWNCRCFLSPVLVALRAAMAA